MALSAPETVTAIYEAFGRRDIARIFALFSPDIEIVQSEELPWGGRYRGHEGALQFFTKLTRNLNSTVEIERLVRAGDVVIVIGWTTGNVNATGVAYRIPIAHSWAVHNGLATRVHFGIDNPTMLEALSAQSAKPIASGEM